MDANSHPAPKESTHSKTCVLKRVSLPKLHRKTHHAWVASPPHGRRAGKKTRRFQLLKRHILLNQKCNSDHAITLCKRGLHHDSCFSCRDTQTLLLTFGTENSSWIPPGCAPPLNQGFCRAPQPVCRPFRVIQLCMTPLYCDTPCTVNCKLKLRNDKLLTSNIMALYVSAAMGKRYALKTGARMPTCTQPQRKIHTQKRVY